MANENFHKEQIEKIIENIKTEIKHLETQLKSLETEMEFYRKKNK